MLLGSVLTEDLALSEDCNISKGIANEAVLPFMETHCRYRKTQETLTEKK